MHIKASIAHLNAEQVITYDLFEDKYALITRQIIDTTSMKNFTRHIKHFYLQIVVWQWSAQQLGIRGDLAQL